MRIKIKFKTRVFYSKKIIYKGQILQKDKVSKKSINNQAKNRIKQTENIDIVSNNDYAGN